jgi:DNA primase
MSNEVENLLREKGIYFKVSGNDYLTKCFSPEHEDSNPSFRIDKIKGIGHCFSCG